MPDVRFILHGGGSESVLQYWQEVGRAGRDGKKATTYMYATKPSIVHANTDMQSICSGIKRSQPANGLSSYQNSSFPSTIKTCNTLDLNIGEVPTFFTLKKKASI